MEGCGRRQSMLRAFVLCAAFFATGSGLVVTPSTPRAVGRTRHAHMGLFDGFAKAFENDSTLGARESAGLKSAAKTKTVTWMGPNGQKKQATVVPGQSLRDIARGCGIPIRYDCQEGTCKTCEAMIGGGRAKIWCAHALEVALPFQPLLTMRASSVVQRRQDAQQGRHYQIQHPKMREATSSPYRHGSSNGGATRFPDFP